MLFTDVAYKVTNFRGEMCHTKLQETFSQLNNYKGSDASTSSM